MYLMKCIFNFQGPLGEIFSIRKNLIVPFTYSHWEGADAHLQFKMFIYCLQMFDKTRNAHSHRVGVSVTENKILVVLLDFKCGFCENVQFFKKCVTYMIFADLYNVEVTMCFNR